MPVLAQFVAVAIALYLWESAAWMPLRGVVLRRRKTGPGWKVVDPESLFTTRKFGLVPLFPVPPDGGFAPCQIPPLLTDGAGNFLTEGPRGRIIVIGPLDWDDLTPAPRHLMAGGVKIAISSPRSWEMLRRARIRGLSLEEATLLSFRRSLSPARAAREWKRWQRISAPLRWYGPALAAGFFLLLPWVYLNLNGLQVLLFALWLWFLMAGTACQLWWLGSKVYPAAKTEFRSDALLSLLVPFHAMRALETAAIHAMATTHPAALLLSTGDWENPWFKKLVRRFIHPLPSDAADRDYAESSTRLMFPILASRSISLDDLNQPPGRGGDAAAAGYCPRCHGLFLPAVATCPDCPGLRIRELA